MLPVFSWNPTFKGKIWLFFRAGKPRGTVREVKGACQGKITITLKCFIKNREKALYRGQQKDFVKETSRRTLQRSRQKTFAKKARRKSLQRRPIDNFCKEDPQKNFWKKSAGELWILKRLTTSWRGRTVCLIFVSISLFPADFSRWT